MEIHTPADFCLNGFTDALDIISEEEANDILKEIEDYINETSGGEEDASPTKWDILKGDARFKVHLFLPKLNQIIWNSNVIGSILTALNSFQPVKRKEQHDLLLWSSDLCIKTANSCGEFPLHQDATYAGLDPALNCVTCWVALSDSVDEGAGCLSFLPQSHLKGQISHTIGKSTANMLALGQEITTETLAQTGLSEAHMVPVPLKRGQASLHSFYTVHRSGPNTKSHPRVGLALRFVSRDVVQKGPNKEMVTWLGQKNLTDEAKMAQEEINWNWDLEPVIPRYQDATAYHKKIGKMAHEEALRREKANYFNTSDVSISEYDRK